ncbi:BON domain-containing protein [Paraburkholderia antibiotica]|uniref:BON domain-containing protein n=1 Tax=Paraburkholderia antibiotica TaxID=2728839 RepID=A0A7Y0A2Y1_9BURK|nr:BON domain-containing protein [Paraburkholderia antibiotica]NML35532.1 BON domain-containing protein [Paraburkholderia antibiotica]
MKAIHAIRLAVGTLLVTGSIAAVAQTNDPTSSANPSGPNAGRSHESLGRMVRNALSHEMGIYASHIIVRSEAGTIILLGTVPDHTASEKAEAIARRVAGVVAVKNALSLRPEGV